MMIQLYYVNKLLISSVSIITTNALFTPLPHFSLHPWNDLSWKEHKPPPRHHPGHELLVSFNQDEHKNWERCGIKWGNYWKCIILIKDLWLIHAINAHPSGVLLHHNLHFHVAHLPKASSRVPLTCKRK